MTAFPPSGISGNNIWRGVPARKGRHGGTKSEGNGNELWRSDRRPLSRYYIIYICLYNITRDLASVWARRRAKVGRFWTEIISGISGIKLEAIFAYDA
jgi:hypothetical protein